MTIINENYENNVWFLSKYNGSLHDEHYYNLLMNSKSTTQKFGPEINPVFIKNSNLVMCLIPKNGITLWKLVLLRLLYPNNTIENNDKKWWIMDQSIHNNKDISKNRINFNLYLNYKKIGYNNYTKQKHLMLSDKSLKFITIIRDPLERVLSGYIYFRWYFKIYNSINFAQKCLFKERDTKNNIVNQHVREQHLFCNLDYLYPKRYDIYLFNNKDGFSFESRLPNKLFSLSLNSISLLTCEVSSLVLVYSIGSLKFSYVSNTETCDISSQSSSITSCLYIFW